MGNRCAQQEDIEKELKTFFATLLKYEGYNRYGAIWTIMQHIPSLVTTNQNVAVLSPIMLTEVEEVVQALPTNKALGPDGFIAEFFKAGWSFLS